MTKTSAVSVVGGRVMVEHGRKAGSDRQGLEILILGNMTKIMNEPISFAVFLRQCTTVQLPSYSGNHNLGKICMCPFWYLVYYLLLFLICFALKE